MTNCPRPLRCKTCISIPPQAQDTLGNVLGWLVAPMYAFRQKEALLEPPGRWQ